MDLQKIKLEKVKNLKEEISKEVIEEIRLSGKSEKEWIRASLIKNNSNPLSGKFTFITKNPVTVEYIPGCVKLDSLLSTLLELTQKNELIASVYPDKSIKIQ